MDFIGQEQIINYIKSKTSSTFPRSLILMGDKGCGKHTVVDIVCEQILKINKVDITDNITLDLILDIQQKPEPYLYIINAPDISIKTQNMLLKFIEEPLKNAYIIILAENDNQLLPTIKNRCQILRFRPYQSEELEKFTDDALMAEICKTPGQIIKSKAIDFYGMIELANKVVNLIGKANLPNTLTIANKLAYKREEEKDGEKFPIDLFCNALMFTITESIINNENDKKLDKKYFALYSLIRQMVVDINMPKVVKKTIVENYLVKFNLCMRDGE